MRGQPTISSVYRFGQPPMDHDPMRTWAKVEMLRRKMFQEHGLIVLRASELPEALKAGIQKWAEDTYGA